MAEERSAHFPVPELRADDPLAEQGSHAPSDTDLTDINSHHYLTEGQPGESREDVKAPSVDGKALSEEGKPLSTDEKAALQVAEVGDVEQQKELLDGTEPIIKTGADVSRYLVSLHDAEDPPLTFRGLFLGTFILILNSVITMVYTAKPVELSLSNVFIILILFVFGYFWSLIMPKASWVENRRGFNWLAPAFHFINPGPMQIKEHVVAFIIGSSGLHGQAASDVLATIKLFYGEIITAKMAIFGIFSVSLIGVGMIGILRPLIIYPSEMVYWYTLPCVAVFQMLHYEKDKQSHRIKMFCYLFGGTLAWEPIVAYICPWLNGVSIPCMASMHAPMPIRKHIARVFGGASANQGLGYLSLSVDPQYVSPSVYAGFPLKWQLNYWIGTVFGGIIVLALFYTNTWQAKTFPFMSAALFRADGSNYDQKVVFGPTLELNPDALASYGVPHMTASNLWNFFCQTLAIGALFSHVFIFWWKDIKRYIKETRSGTQHDPHYQAMKKYKEVPMWWYMTVLVLAVGAAFLTVLTSRTTLPAWGLVVSLVVGALVAPISAILYAQYGSAVATNMMSKMVAGGIHGGRPVANLWFANWCHQVVNLIVGLSDFLKLGQYLKIPWRIMFLIQIYGTLLGAYINWWVISMIISNKREILLDPIGNNQWSGTHYQGLNSQAVQWSLAKYVFRAGTGLHYEIIPLGLLIGATIPCFHWVAKRYIRWVRDRGELITTPLALFYLRNLVGGINSPLTSCVLLGIFMQVYLRVRKPKIFREYCYLLSAAIDGAAEVMVFILSFAVLGGSGKPHPFPNWFGNPAGSPDHCVDTRTYN